MTLSVTVDEDLQEPHPKVVQINEIVDQVPHERPKSSQGDGGNISKKLDLLYPEADRSPDLVRVEELLKYCQEVGLDDKCLRFTEPDYYIDHVQVSTYDNEKIRGMMHSVDRSAMNLQIDETSESEKTSNIRSRQSVNSLERLKNQKEQVKTKYVEKYA